MEVLVAAPPVRRSEDTADGIAGAACLGMVLVIGAAVALIIVLMLRNSAAVGEKRRQAEEERQRQAWHAEQQRQAFLAHQQQEQIAAERTRQAAAQAELERQVAERAEQLIAQFGRENAARILLREYWLGQTLPMLIEALGPPVDRDEKVMKTKHRLTLKYHHQGGNRFALRVFVEDGLVVGWES